MKPSTLYQISEACHGTLLSMKGGGDPLCTGVTIDNRKMNRGDIFFAIQGERTDGHRYTAQALRDGASAVVVERMPEEIKGPTILVDSTLQALKDLAAWYLSTLDVTVVGVTGSVGKTSTKETIASVLSEKYKVLATAGNFNNEIGLPLTIFRIEADTEVAVLEMGISDFGEMDRLAAIARPDIGVITNIGVCHLENLKTRDGILQAKTEMFHHLKKDGIAILNGDDDKLFTVKEVNGVPTRFFGLNGRAGDSGYVVHADHITPRGLKGLQFNLHFAGVEVRDVFLEAVGRHNVYNAMCAAAVGQALDMTPDEIAAGLSKFRTIGGRSNIIETPQLTLIDDCYNANPVSMKEAISTLDLAEGRKIAVLGDMGELGADEAALHAEVGTHLAKTGIQAVFLAGPLCKNLAEAVKKDAPEKEVQWFSDREPMTAALLSYVQPKDNVLVKASHFMKFEEVVEALKGL